MPTTLLAIVQLRNTAVASRSERARSAMPPAVTDPPKPVKVFALPNIVLLLMVRLPRLKIPPDESGLLTELPLTVLLLTVSVPLLRTPPPAWTSRPAFPLIVQLLMVRVPLLTMPPPPLALLAET